MEQRAEGAEQPSLSFATRRSKSVHMEEIESNGSDRSERAFLFREASPTTPKQSLKFKCSKTWLSDDTDEFQMHLQTSPPVWGFTKLTETVVGHSGHRKILRYNAENILHYGFYLPFASGTVYSGAVGGFTFWTSMLQYFLICFLCALLPYLLALDSAGWDESYEGLTAVAQGLKKVTPFVFGLFISLSVRRWWDLRINGLGIIMNACVGVARFIAERLTMTETYIDDGLWRSIEEDFLHLVRYGVASLQCVVMQSRGHYELDGIVHDGLLTVDEAEILDRCCRPSHEGRSQVLWTWITALGWDILNRTSMPPPRLNPFLVEIADAFAAMSRIEAYYDSQLSFCYVHGIVFLIFMHNIVVSAQVGLEFARSAAEGHAEVLPVRVLHLFVLPTMYQALLQLCLLLEDPLGEDLTDFPILSFQERVYNDSKAVLGACRNFWRVRFRNEEELLDCVQAAPVDAAAPGPPPPQTSSSRALTSRSEAELVERLSGRLSAAWREAAELRRLGEELDRLQARLDEAELPREPLRNGDAPMRGPAAEIGVDPERYRLTPPRLPPEAWDRHLLASLKATHVEVDEDGIPREHSSGPAAPPRPLTELSVREPDAKAPSSWLGVCSCTA